MSRTFLKNDINDDGGIPGLELLAVEIMMFSDLSESLACCNAFNVSFATDETYSNKPT